MLSAFLSAFKTPDLRKKLLFTLGIIAIYRLGAALPSPGVSYGNIQSCIEQMQGADTTGVECAPAGTTGALRPAHRAGPRRPSPSHRPRSASASSGRPHGRNRPPLRLPRSP